MPATSLNKIARCCSSRSGAPRNTRRVSLFRYSRAVQRSARETRARSAADPGPSGKDSGCHPGGGGRSGCVFKHRPPEWKTLSRCWRRSFPPTERSTQQQLTLLEEHYQLLLRWNQKINLTRITSLQDAVRYHYCESLYLAHASSQGSPSYRRYRLRGRVPWYPGCDLSPRVHRRLG